MKIKYFSCILILFSILLFFYIFYRSEIVWEGNLRKYYFDYYLISFILFIFSIIYFFLNKNLKKIIFIYLGSFLFALYLFEAYSFLIEKKIDAIILKKYYEETGKTYDTRSVHEFIQYQKNINKKKFIRAISPRNYNKIYSLGGISYSNTVLCNENGFFATYQSDRYGFNNLDEAWEKDKIKYLLVGDSFVHGHCVNRPDDISSVLRKLSKNSVLNLGFEGNGPLIEYATLREYLKPNVENIIWVFFDENDLKINLKEELSSDILNKYLIDQNFSQNLKNKQTKIDINLSQLVNKKTNQLMVFIKLYKTRSLLTRKFKSIDKIEEDYESFKKILSLAKTLAIENKSNFYFVYLPDFSEFYDERYFNQIQYKKVMKIVKDFDIDFIDIKEQLFNRSEKPNSFFTFEMKNHFTVEGYKKVSEIIFERTNKN